MWSPLHQASLACYAITIVLKLQKLSSMDKPLELGVDTE